MSEFEVLPLERELFDGLLGDLLELVGRRVRVHGREGVLTRAVVAGDAGQRAVLVLLDDEVERCVGVVEPGLVDVALDYSGEVDSLTVVDRHGDRSVTFEVVG